MEGDRGDITITSKMDTDPRVVLSHTDREAGL